MPGTKSIIRPESAEAQYDGADNIGCNRLVRACKELGTDERPLVFRKMKVGDHSVSPPFFLETELGTPCGSENDWWRCGSQLSHERARLQDGVAPLAGQKRHAHGVARG